MATSAYQIEGGAFEDGHPVRVSGVARVEDCSVSCTSVRRMPPGWSELVERAWKNQCLGDFWQHCLVAEGAGLTERQAAEAALTA